MIVYAEYLYGNNDKASEDVSKAQRIVAELAKIEDRHDGETNNAKLKARLETVVNRIDKQICHPSESNCKRCGDHRGNCQCGSLSNNGMMKLLKFAKGE